MSWRRFVVGASALGAVGVLARARPAWSAPGGDVVALTAGFNSCGRELFSELDKVPGNLVFSPFSIGTAMAMALSGARGATEQELAKVLKQNLSRPQIEAASQKALATLQAYDATSSPDFCGSNMHWTGNRCEGAPVKGKCDALDARREGDLCVGPPRKSSIRLLLANALMVTAHGRDVITSDYRELLRKAYGAEAFENATLEDINAWASRKTEGEIPKILDKLSDDSAAVLLDAIYLKAGFAKRFGPGSTVDADFYLSPAKAVKTPTMRQSEALPLWQGRGYRAVRLSFTEPNLGIHIVLPDNRDGLAEVSDRLDAAEQARLLAGLAAATPREVDLALPKFKIGFSADLVDPFRRAGLRLALTDGADFSGATAVPGRIKIGNIRHRASIELDENGIKAAAVTAVEFALTSSAVMTPAKPEPFVVDRPFLFFVADREMGAVLFEGRVVDPTKTS